jgi:stage III sporulation protein AH
MLKKFKKSEIAIYAISLMLVAAGYFNYSTFNQKTEETYSEDVGNISEQYANVGDAVLVSNNETENVTDENINNGNVNTNADMVQQENNTSAQNTENNTVAETNAKTTTSSSETTETKTENETDYYANAKLNRDKMYAEMISNYEKIINNPNASEAQKSIATQEITKINNTKNAIMISENLIGTKGFNNCVILVNDGSVNVVVNVQGGLNKENVAKLQNIVSRELKVEIDNIHITEK